MRLTVGRFGPAVRSNPVPVPQTNFAWSTLLEIGGRGRLHDRLARALRTAIRDGRLAEGAAVPPSRALAEELGCSRWVVTEAYGQLVAEGYLSARVG
ncbi:MAG: winged helix-turn-helix transcriptional regulator, partial [Saccharothrix sp.]|nr:winged helix-turn-helix transcriptional regulator [Saccharothrix sp.]